MVRKADEIEGNFLPTEKIYDLLLEGTTKHEVRLEFRDGTSLRGAITFNPLVGRGRVFDIDRDFARDYEACELAKVHF